MSVGLKGYGLSDDTRLVIFCGVYPSVYKYMELLLLKMKSKNFFLTKENPKSKSF